jgi:hypothetical protein
VAEAPDRALEHGIAQRHPAAREAGDRRHVIALDRVAHAEQEPDQQDRAHAGVPAGVMAWASEEQPQRVRTTTLASLPAILGLSPAMVLPFIGAAGRRGQQ